MIPDLPRPIADYVAANARLDLEGMVQAFATDAVVEDDRHRHVGHDEIRSWIQQETIASRAVFTPDTLHHEGDHVVVKGPTAGDFKGSPLRFTFRFALEGDVIRALRITL